MLGVSAADLALEELSEIGAVIGRWRNLLCDAGLFGLKLVSSYPVFGYQLLI
jgi:hypothetical protein